MSLAGDSLEEFSRRQSVTLGVDEGVNECLCGERKRDTML
jgi:hypothetical protein